MNSLKKTKNVLIIKSSPAGENSVSNEIASYLTDQLTNKSINYQVSIRDLAQNTAPQLNGPMMQAFYTPEEHLSDEQRQLVAPSLELIAELKIADIIVIASAMHNFSITSLLKSYIDQICRIGLTFQYTENGPQGLLINKQAVIISSAGMDFQQDSAKAMDFQTPYLERILNFVGITDINFIPVQGVAMGDELAAQAKNNAKIKINELVVSQF